MYRFWRLRCFLIFVLPVLLFMACSKSGGKNSPRTTVQAFLTGMEQMRMATHERSANDNEQGAVMAQKILDESQPIFTLFPDKDKARPLIVTWLMMRVKNPKVLDQTIEGEKAKVRVQFTQIGASVQKAGASPKVQHRVLTFSLRRVDGRWLIANVESILGKDGI